MNFETNIKNKHSFAVRMLACKDLRLDLKPIRNKYSSALKNL